MAVAVDLDLDDLGGHAGRAEVLDHLDRPGGHPDEEQIGIGIVGLDDDLEAGGPRVSWHAPPMMRHVRSSAATTEPILRSLRGRTTRKRLHASQAQNNTVREPPTIGPSPKLFWSHKPSSGIQGL